MTKKLNPDGWLNLSMFKQVFLDHIIADIQLCTENKRYVAAAQLLMSAIDTAAGLERPINQEDTTKQQFIAWASKYLALSSPEYTLTGTDVYAARCGLLHGYTSRAKLVRERKAIELGWLDAMEPPVRCNESKTLALVSLTSLLVAFSHGLADTMKRINGNEDVAEVVNTRLGYMFQARDLDPALKAHLQATAEAYRAAQEAMGAVG